MKISIKCSLTFLLLIILFNGIVIADWPCRSDSAVPLVTLPGNQWNVHMISDQKNGAIMAWQDRRGGSGDKIYVQRINSYGVPVWQQNGIRLTATEGYQYYPQIISDGKGGAFIAWQDNRSGSEYDIYIQRVDSDGNLRWGLNGKVVCGAPNNQYNPQIVSDGSGGVMVVWQDRRIGQFDIYAQRFDSVGRAQWISDGIAVCSDTSNQIDPKLISDYKGGAIIAWADYRLGAGSTDIYTQRILSDGQPGWQIDGIPICTAVNIQWNIQIVPDTTGGAIIAWQDRRNWTYDNIFAQRVDPNGYIRWTVNGLPLAQLPSMQYYPQMVSDRNGGAIVVWQDNRRGTDYDIFGQRITREGMLVWPPIGVPICTAPGLQSNPQLIVQGSYCIVTWQDKRGADYDIYAQRLNLSGQVLWAIDGNPVSAYPLDQFMPQLNSDSMNGAIFAWADYCLHNGSIDIYTHRIGANGLPAGGSYRTFVQDSFALRAKRFVNWKKQIIAMPNSGNVRDSVFRRGIWPYGLVVGVERWDKPRLYWWLRFVKAYYIRRALPQTWLERPLDYTHSRIRFVGEMKNPSFNRYNNRLVGELLTLKINIAASDLGITQEGFGDLVFKDTSSQIVNPLNNKRLRQVTSTVDSMLTMWTYYPHLNYKMICNALQMINSAFNGKFDTISSKPLRVTSTKSLFSIPFLRPSPDPPPPLPEFQQLTYSDEMVNDFTLYQNYPNPFNPVTTIEFNLPEPAIVTLKVFNVLGQEVSVPIDRRSMDADHEIINFDASNLPSGIYFYQVIGEPLSGGTIMSQVKKMIVLK
jgi:hypothetical protein